MKKVLYFVAIATLAFVSCQKEIETTNDAKNDRFTFKASIEDLASKATINADNQLVWATGDKIGIYVNDDNWTDKNQPFTLSSGAGTTEGEFAWDYEGNFSDKAAAAFFPWEGTGSDKNNVYEGTMYFKLRDAYYNYESGGMLTPLIASLENSSSPINFKHAGAAVKVTINNVPANVHSFGMSVDGQQITGTYSINPENAGTDALTFVNTDGAEQNKIWLNFTNGLESKWDFIFPVPELTKPKLSFQMYDNNGVLVWSKNLRAQPSDLGRGDILVMPATDITPYEKFNRISDTWYIRGTLVGNDWSIDVPVLTDGEFYIAKNLSFTANGEFKIKKAGTWDDSWPSGNYKINNAEAGTYDIVFKDTEVLAVIPSAESPYPGSVTLYVHPNTPVKNELCFKSSTLGTASWPGTPFSSYEIVAGSKYYTMTFSAPMLWGQTITDLYVVDRDNWSAKDGGCSLTFPSGKTEYYILATKNEDLVLQSKRPDEPSITIDGVFTDWANVSGNTNEPSSTGNISTLKAYSDGTSLFLYHKMTPGTDVTFDLSGWRYFRIYFDTDNDATTGWDTSHWLYAGADIVAHGENNHDILVYHCKGGLANASIEDVVGAHSLKAVSNADGSIEVELQIALSDLGTISGDEIKLYTVASVASSQSSYGILGGIMIPTVTP